MTEEEDLDREPVGSYTVIHDAEHNAVITRLEGFIPLPVGSLIEMQSADVVKVVGIRLLRPSSLDEGAKRYLCLDVRLVRGS